MGKNSHPKVAAVDIDVPIEGEDRMSAHAHTHAPRSESRPMAVITLDAARPIDKRARALCGVLLAEPVVPGRVSCPTCLAALCRLPGWANRLRAEGWTMGDEA